MDIRHELAGEKPVDLKGVRVRQVHQNGIVARFRLPDIPSGVPVNDVEAPAGQHHAAFQIQSGRDGIQFHIVHATRGVFADLGHHPPHSADDQYRSYRVPLTKRQVDGGFRLPRVMGGGHGSTVQKDGGLPVAFQQLDAPVTTLLGADHRRKREFQRRPLQQNTPRHANTGKQPGGNGASSPPSSLRKAPQRHEQQRQTGNRGTHHRRDPDD
jgi:hypothetical protein